GAAPPRGGIPPADPHAHRPQSGARCGERLHCGGRRLHDQAVLPARTGGPDHLDPGPPMIELDARLILTVLVAVWILIALSVLLLGAVHSVRALRRRRRDRLAAQARPLVVRFTLFEDDDRAPAAALRTASGAFGDR